MTAESNSPTSFNPQRLLKALDVPQRPVKSQHLSAYAQDDIDGLLGADQKGVRDVSQLDAHQLADVPFQELLDDARSLSVAQLKQVVGEADTGERQQPIPNDQSEVHQTLDGLNSMTEVANESVRELLREVNLRHDADGKKE